MESVSRLTTEMNVFKDHKGKQHNKQLSSYHWASTIFIYVTNLFLLSPTFECIYLSLFAWVY